MSKNGIRQLKNVSIYFCDIGGSSRGVREFIHSGNLASFAESNPDTQFYVQLVRGRHPHIKAEYLNGREFAHDCKNKTVEQIEQKMINMRNIWGNKAKKIGSAKKTLTPSVQGLWSPLLWRFSTK